ncbi:unnamed protein product, partial [Mesorhabditis belari]|uniref:Splicing factor 3A subunit 1 n=1 Tax=Mesorhabditis belari TaxID=2138241 RepID=A0AAF3EM63_9BILA
MPPVTAPPPPVVSRREEDSMNTEASMSGKAIIGLIYPPPDIRTIVDKTANFVARNGVDFENKIREKEAANLKFTFLSPTDPYNAYYKHKVKELQEGKTEAPRVQVPDAVKEHVKKVAETITRPPTKYEFSDEPTTINAFDLDLIKLTALFVARNGRQFMTNLMNREMRNYQFDFLKPQHSNFQYFSQLVEQYTKVLIPSKTIVDELRSERENKKKLLDEVERRVRWEKYQKSLKDKADAEAEKERVAYAQIDWHDFVLVQTVDFSAQDLGNLPGLCTSADVGARVLLEARKEQEKANQDAAMDMEESDSEDEQEIAHEIAPTLSSAPAINLPRSTGLGDDLPADMLNQPIPNAPTKQGNILIREDYDPKRDITRRPTVEEWIISPLTGEKMPKNKITEHVRYNTVDSQYKEERDARIAQTSAEEGVFAPGMDISKNLNKFADRRTDIFGVGEEGAKQTIIGKKLGEADAPNKPTKDGIWDGTAETMESATREAQKKVTLEQQLKDLHRQHGYVPDPEKERIGAQPASAASEIPPPPQAHAPIVRPPMPPPASIPAPPSAIPIPARSLPPAPHLMPGLPPILMRGPMVPTIAVPGMPIVPMAVPIISAPAPMPMLASIPPRPQMDFAAQPPAKKQKTEDDLEPEHAWLAKVPPTIEVRILLPQDPQWQLDGSVVSFNVESAAMVSTLKQKVFDRYQMPVNKQKLNFESFVLKDTNSFAYYNISQHAFLSLGTKERGGKKSSFLHV